MLEYLTEQLYDTSNTAQAHCFEDPSALAQHEQYSPHTTAGVAGAARPDQAASAVSRAPCAHRARLRAQEAAAARVVKKLFYENTNEL